MLIDANGKPIKVSAETPVCCENHGTRTTWGALDAIQQLAVEEGLDTSAELPCLLSPEMRAGQQEGESRK